MRAHAGIGLIVCLLAGCGASTALDAPDPSQTSPVPTATAQAEPEAARGAATGESAPADDARPPGLRALTTGWNTDWSRHTVEYTEILSGGPPRDGIPSIDEPRFQDQTVVDWLAETEPVIALDIAGDARAYPIAILTWHEIVNDVVGGVPVAVTFCPLCNSAIAFDRRVDGEVYEFGVSGLLRHSDLIMYDRSTESLWQQFTGEGIVGQHAGDRLTIIPAGLVSYREFRQAYPAGRVLSRETGFSRPYGSNPYEGYDSSGFPFLFRGSADGRLPLMERVVGVSYGGVQRAYPYTALAGQPVINDEVGGQPLVVFYAFGTNSALDASRIAEARDVGASGVFNPIVEGQALSFEERDGAFVDRETGSVWNLSGQAVSGPLQGAQMARLVSTDHFWFAWAAFYPETEIGAP